MGFLLALVVGAQIAGLLLVVFCRCCSFLCVPALAFATVSYLSFVVSGLSVPCVLLFVIELLVTLFGCCSVLSRAYACCRALLLFTFLCSVRFQRCGSLRLFVLL